MLSLLPAVHVKPIWRPAVVFQGCNSRYESRLKIWLKAVLFIFPQAL